MSTAEPASVSFYEEFARDYPLFFADLPANMAQEGEWLDSVLGARGVTRVLDASCGSGRQAIPLAQRGYAVTGVDPCAAMLREARTQAEALGLDVQWTRGQFIDLPTLIAGRFEAVIALGNGLCNQERPEAIEAALRALRECVLPGGVCLIGIKDYDAIRGERVRFHGHTVCDEAGERHILFETWDFEDPILVCTAYALRGREGDWTVRTASTREYMLGAEALAEAARRAGFAGVSRLAHPSEAVFALEVTS